MTSGDEGKLFAGLPEHPAPERTYQDKPRLRMAERRQVELRAICLDDLVPTDDRVRMVWTFVEGCRRWWRRSRRWRVDRAIRRRTRASCWRCGCLPRPTALAAPASWRGCVTSTSPTSGCAAVSV